MLEVNGWFKDTEQDNYENGCIGNGFSHSGNDRFVAKTESELIQKLMDFVGVSDKDCVSVNSCGDAGRIDICRTENDDSYEPTARELERFKNGEIDLWYSTYIFHAEKVTRKTFTFSKNCGYSEY